MFLWFQGQGGWCREGVRLQRQLCPDTIFSGHGMKVLFHSLAGADLRPVPSRSNFRGSLFVAYRLYIVYRQVF